MGRRLPPALPPLVRRAQTRWFRQSPASLRHPTPLSPALAVPWLIGGELLPEGPRASGMAVAAGVNWIFTSVIAMGFQPVKTALGNYCFLPFVGFLVVTFLFALKYGA